VTKIAKSSCTEFVFPRKIECPTRERNGERNREIERVTERKGERGRKRKKEGKK